jgi:DNA polymerase-3 subunit delta
MVIYGKDASIRQILETARRFPMMAQRQVVLVKEAQEIQDLKKKQGQDALAAYAKVPVPSTVLVFAHKHKKLDGRAEVSKILDKQAILMETKRLYDNQVSGWVKDYCKGKNVPISEKACVLMAEHIGNNLSRIANEIDKILISLEKGKEITDAVVAQQVGVSKEYNVFELQTALAQKDVLKANQIISYFEANPKDNPIIPMISSLFGYFSKVLIMHHQQDKSPNELAAQLKVNPYFLKEYQVAKRNYTLPKTVKVIEYLHEADLRSKGVNSNMDEGAILKELIYKILH